jgi:TolB-like protein
VDEIDLPEGNDARLTTVFFSYSREDRVRILPFIQSLEDAGYCVWWDGVLEGGTRYIDTTEEALKGAAAVIVLWSKSSINSHWVQDEAMSGRERGCLIPLSIDGVEPPLGFRQFQVIDISRSYGRRDDPEVVSLIRATAALHGRQAPDRPAPKAPLYFAIRRRRLVFGGTAAAAALLGGYAISRILPSSARAMSDNSIVVYPFENISGQPEQDYLSAGLSAEIRATLARNSALKVVAQSSSEALKKQAMDAVTTAKQLGVAYLLDGTVRQTGKSLRISAELIDGKTGFSRWSRTFEHSVDDVLLVESEIANAVTTALSVEMSQNAGGGQIGATSNVSAFNEYLKGNDLYTAAISNETDIQALSHFDAAIALDPKFAAAHSARARVLTVIGNSSDSAEKAQLYYESAEKAAYRGTELGPDLADSHSTLGFVLFQARLRIKEARKPYDRSRELGNGDAAVLARFAGYAAATGQDQVALTAIERARDLDPLNPTIHRALGFVHYASGRYERSIQSVEQALSLNPQLSDSYARVGSALIHLGRPGKALTVCAKEHFGLVRYPCLAIANWKLGDTAEASNALAALINEYGDGSLYQQAQILAQTGEHDRAMETLYQALKGGDSGLTYLYIDPMLFSLRERTDYKQLLAQLGFV